MSLLSFYLFFIDILKEMLEDSDLCCCYYFNYSEFPQYIFLNEQ